MARPEWGCARNGGRRADEERVCLPRRSDILGSLRQIDQTSPVPTSSGGQQANVHSADRLQHTEQSPVVSEESIEGREARYAQLRVRRRVSSAKVTESAERLTAVHNSLCFHNLESRIGRRDAATRAEDAAPERKHRRCASDVLRRQLFEACESNIRRQTNRNKFEWRLGMTDCSRESAATSC